MGVRTVWEALDPAAAPRLEWIRPVSGDRVVLLLGAFDPPTLAHVALLAAGARHAGIPGAFCLTKVLLDREGAPLLDPVRRLELLVRIAEEDGFGAAVCNKGAYVDVAAACRASRVEPVFLVGSDKLPQLEDPRFYADGADGVERTFTSARFLAVPRGVGVSRPEVEVLDASSVFRDADVASISATSVRDRVRRGESVDHDVPPGVALALRDYTGLA